MSNVTSIEAIKNQAVKEVELPGWEEGEVFVARLKRPSMITLVAEGKIPNTLLGVAQEMFPEGKKKQAKPEDVKVDQAETIKVFQAIAKASLVEPTFDELVNAGVELTDDQLMKIFEYSQSGVRALDSFRKDA